MRTESRLVSIVAIALLGLVLLPATSDAQKLVLVVRHAERADGGSSSPTAQPDPLLSAAGQARAARLAQMLAESGITALYTTEFKRAHDTAKPLADLLKLQVTMVASPTAGLVARIKKEQPSGIVLIVGHSNTVPEIVKAFGGPTFTIDDDRFGDLFVVVPGTGVMTKVKF